MIYLLHFTKKLHHAQHYLGYCHEGGLDARFARHCAGRGSRLVRAVVRAGIGVKIVRTWPGGDRTMERTLKRRKHSARLCPICCRIATAKATKRKERRNGEMAKSVA